MFKVMCSFPLTEEDLTELESVSKEYRFVFEKETDVDIILGNVPAATLKDYPDLKWFQSCAVGIDSYIRKGVLNDGVILTNAVAVHTKPVAEHTLALILELTKKLYRYRDDQARHLWVNEGLVKEYGDMKVCIVGFGDIGNSLARMLKALGMYTIGVKRRMIEKPEYLDELYTDKDLIKAISDVDVVVTILPGNSENAGLFTLDTFRAMRPDTIMVNVGRGNLYSEETLKEVLDKKIIAAIASDVFLKEPLDGNSPLWDHRDLVITPHVAGGYHTKNSKKAFVKLCKENLLRFINNDELKNVVSQRED